MHKHHIIPKSRGGTDDEWNLTELSPYDHAHSHALDFVLFEKAPWFDCRQEGWSLLPKDLQKAVRKEISRRNSLNTGDKNPFFGKTHTVETRQKLREAKLGTVQTPESNAKRSATQTGQPKTEEWKRKIGDANRGRKKPVVTCPHCGKQGGTGAMHQHHFDNCRVKPK